MRRLAARKATFDSCGATVIAIGPGSLRDAQRLAATLEEQIPVLADETGAVPAAFGFRRVMLGAISQSGAVIVDRDGIIRYARRVTNPSAALDERGLFHALKQL